MKPARLALGGLFFLAAATPRAASASGISVARFGGEHGHPTTTNATAIFYNPAGIGMSEGIHLFADGNFAWRSVTYDHELNTGNLDDGSVSGANDGEAKLFNILVSPMVGATAKFGDFALGAGFYTPYGGQSIWDKNDKFENDPNYAGPYDGVQRWYVMEGIIRTSFITLAAAYHIKPARLSIGLSGNLMLSTVDTVRGKTASGSNDLDEEGRAYLSVKGTDWGLGLGVLYEAIEKQLWVGASYQSRPNLTGMNKLEGDQKTVLPPNMQESVEPVTLEQDLPDSYRLGFRYRPTPTEDWELRLFGDYTRWSVLKYHRVQNTNNDSYLLDQRRDWKDTFAVRAGASKWLSKPVEVFAGAGFASNAVPDETLEPALPDWDGISLAAGGRFEIIENLHAAASYTQIFYLPRDNNGKSKLTELSPKGAPRNPDSGGDYKQMVGVLNLNVDFQF